MSLQGHKKRVLVAVIALPILLIVIIKLPPYFFFGLLCIVSVMAMLEFLNMYNVSRFWSLTGAFLSVILFALNCFYSHNTLYYYAILFCTITVIRLFLKKEPHSALRDIAPVIIGLLYIPTLLCFQWFLMENGWQWIIYLFGCVWASDSLAFYIGKGFGKRKLYPEVSPKKTWAGAYGSIAGGTIASLILGSFLLSKSFISLLIVGFLIGFVSIFGDLVESMFKRDAGVKDSGFLFPEHGGILDKADAMLFAGVLLYFGIKFM
ncbi:phosphatidate cytidylyltransferase [Thermodesulfovibrio thiophilus]|uniref:phosphatidate cytidylyltransferase n=1 Tax=Thermodesulfovibrio thiophilus TaxID=340095 RepID=UPI00181EB1F5|nr:CDP-archaeol synthase [Thermodesulfovibrio thiophilus]HHW20671.1 CDP-archaeol synthase [Thermodesulfovibrio thiophilus]